MAYELRPLRIAELLDYTFDIYRRNFLLFLGISAVPNTASLLLQLAVQGRNPTPRVASGVEVGAAFAAQVSVGLVSLIVTYIVTAATTFAVSEIYLNIPTSVWGCYARVARKATRILLVSFVAALIIGIGTALCIAPGIYWTGKYGLAVPAIVLESITSREALDRSANLAQGAFGRIIGAVFLTAIFAGAMSYALDRGIEVLVPVIFHGPAVFSRIVAQEIISTFVGTLLNPVSAIAITLVYYDQRVRREAFDIERMMSLLAPRDLAAGAAAG